MNKPVTSPEAELDLDGIWEYIAGDSISAADRFLAKLHLQILELAQTHGMGHRREDLAADRPLLFWAVGSYLIVYRQTSKGFIEIVLVSHGNRDIPAIIERRGL